jgi:hypothetical protein
MPSYLSTRAFRSHASRKARRYRPTLSPIGPTVGQCFDIEVTRDGNWWMIRIPEIAGLTQARRRGEVELMARECIAVRTGIPIGYVTVRVVND